MSRFDPIVHAPLRLQLCGFLATVDEAEFATLRDQLGVADSVLSKHVSTLVAADYVRVKKETLNGRRTTWIALTRTGRKALQGHLQALQHIIDAADAPPERTPAPEPVSRSRRA